MLLNHLVLVALNREKYMIAQNIQIETLEEWQRDLKQIAHEINNLPAEEEPTFYDDKIDEVVNHLQSARVALAVIARGIEAETGQKVKTYPDYSSSNE